MPEPFGLIFVGGAPRSGTTLVQRILGAHSMVYAGPEFDLVPEIMRLRGRFLKELDAGRISVYMDEGGVNSVIAEFLTSVFARKMRGSGRMFFSEKTPANLEVFPELRECLPDARFLFVMRDPRAVVASMLEVGRKYRNEFRLGSFFSDVKRVLFSESTADGSRGRPSAFLPPPFTRPARLAVEYINILWSRGNAARAMSDNVHVVYYEDLVNEPERIVRAMADFLGIPFEDRMLNVQESRVDMPEFKAGEQFWYTKEQLLTPIEKDALEKWRHTLTAYDRYVIHKHLTRIPGLTDRYPLTVKANVGWAFFDFWGTLFARLRLLLIKISSSLSKVL